MKIVKALFYEVFVTRLIYRFILWLKSEGYDEEGDVMISAMISWTNKKNHGLNVDRK